MPTNVTPEYKAAEAAYRAARDPQARLDALRDMLRTLPKHKGTDHLQAGIKTRIKELTEQMAAPRKGGARSAPPTAFRPEGAAQVALIGPANAGKSALHALLTGSHAASEPYPFTTRYPQPGMAPFEDVAFQLVDLPSVAAEHLPPWIGNALQPSEAALLVVDLTQPGCVEAAAEVRRLLSERRVELVGRWPAEGVVVGEDPFTLVLPTAVVVNKIDLLEDPQPETAAFMELAGFDFPVLAVSAATGEGIDAIGRFLFERLGIVRVYTRTPGRKEGDVRPFTLRKGQTVADVALEIHKEMAASLHYARLWSAGGPAGRQVGRDHELSDGDVIELH